MAANTADAGNSCGGANSSDGALCHTLGPEGFDGNLIVAAEADGAGRADGGWEITVRIAAAGQDQANATFNECFEGDASCPAQSSEGRGEIAIVLDGAVISAPAVNGSDLALDTFATELAARLDRQS